MHRLHLRAKSFLTVKSAKIREVRGESLFLLFFFAILADPSRP